MHRDPDVLPDAALGTEGGARCPETAHARTCADRTRRPTDPSGVRAGGGVRYFTGARIGLGVVRRNGFCSGRLSRWTPDIGRLLWVAIGWGMWFDGPGSEGASERRQVDRREPAAPGEGLCAPFHHGGTARSHSRNTAARRARPRCSMTGPIVPGGEGRVWQGEPDRQWPSTRRHAVGESSMSDTPQGPGWWLASDGKYYPPQPPAPPTRASPDRPSDDDGPSDRRGPTDRAAVRRAPRQRAATGAGGADPVQGRRDESGADRARGRRAAGCARGGRPRGAVPRPQRLRRGHRGRLVAHHGRRRRHRTGARRPVGPTVRRR